MIIERKYVTLKVMCEKEPEYKKILYGNLESSLNEEQINKLLWNRLADLDLGCGLSGKGYSELCEYCEKMDKTKPFDNGYTIADIDDVNITFKHEDYLQVTFYRTFDGLKDIVKVKEVFSNEDL